MAALTHRNEQTGSPAMDRIQGNVRSVIEYVRQWIPALARSGGVGLCHVTLTASNYADYTLTTAEAACAFIRVEGAIPAAGLIRLPQATDATAYFRHVINVTTGGFAVTVATVDGTASVPFVTTKGVVVSATGPATF